MIESSEESVLLSPDAVLVLLSHADLIDQVQMREGNHTDRVVVLDEGEPITELAVIYEVTDSSDRLRNLVLLDLTLEKLGQINGIEATSTGLKVFCWNRLSIIFFLISDIIRLINIITDRVQVRLVHIHTLANVQTFEGLADIQLLVVECQSILRDFDKTVHVLTILIRSNEERM